MALNHEHTQAIFTPLVLSQLSYCTRKLVWVSLDMALFDCLPNTRPTGLRTYSVPSTYALDRVREYAYCSWRDYSFIPFLSRSARASYRHPAAYCASGSVSALARRSAPLLCGISVCLSGLPCRRAYNITSGLPCQPLFANFFEIFSNFFDLMAVKMD